MFPFGSVLTNIPLIVLAAVYLLYMGASAVSRTKTCDDEPEACSGKPVNIILAENPELKENPDAFYFLFLPDSQIDSDSCQDDPDIRIYQSECPWLFLPGSNVLSLFSGSAVFSRPPPRG